MARTRVFQDTPSFTTGAYSANDNLGGLRSIPNFVREALSGFIYSLRVTDLSGQTPALDVILFRAQPVGTFTDNNALPAAASYPPSSILEVIPIVAADYRNIQGNVAIARINLDKNPIQLQLATTTFYYAIKVIATPTLTDGCLTFNWGVSQD